MDALIEPMTKIWLIEQFDSSHRRHHESATLNWQMHSETVSHLCHDYARIAVQGVAARGANLHGLPKLQDLES